MPDILRWLFEQPLILLLLVAWIFSALGGVMQRVARRAQAEAQRGADASEPVADAAPPQTRRRDADEIAREIRRAMGLEPPAPSPAPPLPSQAERKPPIVESAAPQRSRDVGERRPRRVPPREERPQRLQIVPDSAPPRESLRAHLEAADAVRASRDALRVVPGARRRRTRSVLDLSRPAAALVAAEVLGPPLALRPAPFPREPRDH